MEIIDFLPKYPNVDNSEYKLLNPYDNFYESIFRKKEFYDNRLEKNEQFPKHIGDSTKYQQTIARYLSSKTPYDGLLLVHEPGLGKTCSAIGAIEQIISENSSFTGAIILAKGKPLLNNFIYELVHKCTHGQYIPENFSDLKELEKVHRIKKKIAFYDLNTFAVFAKKIKKITDEAIIQHFSNKIVVIDEVHNIRMQDTETTKAEAIQNYNQMHRFLHLIKNKKVILLSGTPMKDSPDEIASVLNLILPLDKQLSTGDDFMREYFNNEGFIQEKAMQIKTFVKGYVSFLKEAESSIKKVFIGKKEYKELKYFTVSPQIMSDFQTQHYTQAYESDTEGKQGVYNNSREATLFVYPDGSYGSKGFKKYILPTQRRAIEKRGKKIFVSDYKMSNELKKELSGKTNEEKLKKLKKFSAIYSKVISNILETKGNCFIFSSVVQGSGAILFSLILELFGFSKATGKEQSKQPRYAILTHATVTEKMIRKINAVFNSKENMKGDIIKVIIGSKTVSEGFSFKNVVFESVNTPFWNYSDNAQAIARGIRLGSHNDLLQAGENPVVRILQPVAIPKNNILSIDLYKYKIAEDKDIKIRAILRLLMESAMDCALNYYQNYNEYNEDYSRECDYTICQYNCDGINNSEISGLPLEKIDYSTYQLYYANKKQIDIHKRIEKIFRNNVYMSIKTMFVLLQKDFTQEEINIAFSKLTKEKFDENEQINYKTYLRLYANTTVKKIILKLEEMFKENFSVSLDVIQTYLLEEKEEKEERYEKEKYTLFEIVTSLREIINENIVIYDKYNFPCYLREEKNLYFLVSNLTLQTDLFTEYYIKNPAMKVSFTFQNVIEKLQQNYIPQTIEKICKNKVTDINTIIKTLPQEIQELFIESAITAKYKKIEKNKDLRDKILTLYSGYIKKVGDMIISKFPANHRCYETKTKEWKNCDYDILEKLTKKEEKKLEKMKTENPYGIIGKYNPENGLFCIVDFKKEEEKKKAGRDDKDMRLSYSGKVCSAGGWKLHELIRMMTDKLDVPPPQEFKENISKEDLLKEVRKDKKIMSVFSEDEIKSKDKKQLRSVLYWGSSKHQGKIKSLCENLKNWLEQNKLLLIDNQCGVQGKRKKEAKTDKTPKYVFRIEQKYDDSYRKDLTKIYSDVFREEKFSHDPKKQIYIVFSRKKIVLFVYLDNGNLTKLSVAKNYRKIADVAIKQLMDVLFLKYNKYPNLTVDNNKKRLISFYEKIGFQRSNNVENILYMSFKK